MDEVVFDSIPFRKAIDVVSTNGDIITLMICRCCGATIMSHIHDPDSLMVGHAAWHRHIDNAIESNRPNPRLTFIGG